MTLFTVITPGIAAVARPLLSTVAGWKMSVVTIITPTEFAMGQVASTVLTPKNVKALQSLHKNVLS